MINEKTINSNEKTLKCFYSNALLFFHTALTNMATTEASCNLFKASVRLGIVE